ncbi:MAG: Fe-S-containing hydro-lyase [Bacillota bacterium]|nr:Fe-S-containing hydro-lyase [Bacillota bacterium]
MEAKRIRAPLTDADVMGLKAGDNVLISGVIYAARDAAHKKLVELLEKKEALPFDLKGQFIYYVGPTPAKPGQVIGSAGPTTSGRMDSYTPKILENGIKAVIGKGSRSAATVQAFQDYKGIYLAATGGAGALLAKTIKEAEIVAYPELGPEAIRCLVVEDFPATVINDAYGNDLYEEGRRQYVVK